jgi:cation diffusion facilitator CzcD-associated flavoprotein CzcO
LLFNDMTTTVRRTTVVVIGAGQAGLSAAYHLRRRGFEFVVLDADSAPGGAWQHRWRSLRMATVNGIFDLPGMAMSPAGPDGTNPDEPSADAVPRYFAAYEREFELPILRPVRVTEVRRADDDPAGNLIVETDHGAWAAKAVINATGTWTSPHIPWYPGQNAFSGRQLHVADYVSAAEFAGQRVIVVGGGISAIQLLDEISQVTGTTWFTRREPVWLDGDFQPETTGRAVVARVQADVERGLPPRSIVSYTGLAWTPYAKAAKARGALERLPMFTAIEPDGVRLADGGFQPADVILWATGFRAALGHLAPLHLRNDLGGIAMDGTAVAAEPRVHLIGYGPSQSTVGGNRAGRDAVRAISKLLHLSPEAKAAANPPPAS